MKKFSPKLKIFLYSALVLSAIAIILFSLSTFTSYDNGPNYFSPSVFVSIATAISVISVALFFFVFMFLPKGELDGATPITLPVIVPSAFCALIFAGVGVVLLLCSASAFGMTSFFTGIGKGALTTVAGIACIISAIYFLVNCFSKAEGNGAKHAYLGFSLPISSVLLIAISYFDITVSMNAPIKAMFHLSMLSFMIWSLYEIRNLIGKASPRAYFAFGLCTMLLSGIASLPYIIYSLVGGLSSPVYPTYLLYNFISLAIFFYASIRIIVFVCARDLLERISDQTDGIEETEYESADFEEDDTNEDTAEAEGEQNAEGTQDAESEEVTSDDEP